MAILNYTTSIAAVKTAGEMQAALAKHGASSVSVVYEAGEPRGIAFSIDTEFGMRDFQLPANATAVEKILAKQTRERKYHGPEHANRVAWRILKDWLLAQLAIIETGMVNLDEVMLPYMLTNNGLTLTQAYRSSPGVRAIAAGDSS
jgi:hypothetical protein